MKLVPQPFPPSSPWRGSHKAFTLVELISVMALVGIILLVAMSVSNSSLDNIRQSRARIAADEIASTAFDQITLDLQQRLARNETIAQIEKNTGNDELILMSTRPGYPPPSPTGAYDRRASTVQYRVSDGQLVQAASGCQFGSTPADAGTLKLYNTTGNLADLDATSYPFLRLAPGVLRMELSALKSSGIVASPGNINQSDALIVTLVVLDPARAKMLSSTQWNTIANEFTDAADVESSAAPLADQMLFQTWNAKLSTLLQNTSFSGIPRSVLQHVRVYQRCISLRNIPVS
jgi:prepilin-type N-terminal cleavage/methylation domain-containing protein